MIAPPHLIIFTSETKPGTHKPIRFLAPFAISFITDQCNDDKFNKAIFCIILFYVCIAISFCFQMEILLWSSMVYYCFPIKMAFHCLYFCFKYLWQ